MRNVKRIFILLIVALIVCAASFTRATLSAAVVKVPDPTKVVMIVDRDSNDVAFMDIDSKKIVGRTFLGNTVVFLHEILKDKVEMLFEGAQGTFLDIDFGTYPYVTSSNTTSGSSLTNAPLTSFPPCLALRS